MPYWSTFMLTCWACVYLYKQEADQSYMQNNLSPARAEWNRATPASKDDVARDACNSYT